VFSPTRIPLCLQNRSFPFASPRRSIASALRGRSSENAEKAPWRSEGLLGLPFAGSVLVLDESSRKFSNYILRSLAVSVVFLFPSTIRLFVSLARFFSFSAGRAALLCVRN